MPIKSKRDKATGPFMTRAIALAIENVRTGQGGPFAALVVKNAEILAEAANRVTAENDPTAHAEILAIREACRKLGRFELRGCDIYSSCEPCPMCLGAIYWARPAKVYFGSTAANAAKAGFDDSLIYKEMRKPFARRRIPMVRMRCEAALEPFRAWERKKDKMSY